MVWLTKELKEYLKDRLVKRGEEIGIPDFYDKIADETVAKDAAELLKFLEKVDHPVLKLDPML